MKKCITTNFILCGLCGWCMECLWTGLHSALKHEDRLCSCYTSIWMFPIYGMAAFIAPISKKINKKCALVRGSVYTICIFLAEYGTGNVLKRYKACPWDYSKAKLNYHGVIRFDYAPLWFFVGLFYEKLLSK
jgi:uncharacterized membrane protein